MDGILTILTILILVVPLIAKAIEKSLMKAGRPDMAGKVRDLREQLEGQDRKPVAGIPPVLDEPFPTAVFTPEVSGQEDSSESELSAPVRDDLHDEGYVPVKEIVDSRRTKPGIAVGTAPAEKGEKLEIDPKKLILYSEIMKTKF